MRWRIRRVSALYRCPVPVPARDLSREVGALIRDRMLARGLTQTKVAASVGISQPQLSRCLSGKTSWDLDELDAVCKYLGTRASDVVAVAEDSVGAA